MSERQFLSDDEQDKYEVSLGGEIAVLTILGLATMIFIEWYSYNKRVGADVADFFSASKSLRFLIIGLTIFADSYSGNSFLGYAAETYRSGTRLCRRSLARR